MGIRTLVSAAIVIASSSTTSALAAPDTIYTNAKVITADDQFSIANSFAIEGNRFTHVGTMEQVIALADEKTQVINLKGRTVIPGLIDNHNHFIRGAYHWDHSVRLDGISSRSEALQKLKKHAEKLDENEWLLVQGGWNEEQFTDDPRGFTREELDHISGNRPAFIQAQYSHAFVNTAFLKRIDANLQQTPGKKQPQANSAIDKLFGLPLSQLIERDEEGVATSKLSGGMGMVLQASTIIPAPSKETALAGVKAAQKDFNRLGLTTVYDPAGALATQFSVDAVEQLHQRDELSLRVFRTTQLSSLNTEIIERALQLRALPVWLSDLILGVIRDTESTSSAIEVASNLPALFTGDDFYDTLAIGEVLYIPMHDTLDSHITTETLSQHRLNQVKSLLAEILSRGLSAQIHAVNPQIIDAYLSILEELSTQYSLHPNQITLTHVEGVNNALLRRIQSLGIGVQIRSMSVVRSISGIEKAHGHKALTMPALRNIQDSGVTWGLGTDGTKASQINPMRTLYWAISGKAINGDQVLHKSQRLSREEALIAHTRSNAILLSKGNRLGQIRSGYLADFVVLDQDYLAVDIDEIPNINVDMTVVGGKTVYKH